MRISLKPLSDETARALAALAANSESDPTPVLDRVSKSGELVAAEPLLSIALNGDRRLRARAASAINQLVERARPLELAAFDQRWREANTSTWWGLDPDDLSRLKGFPIAATGIASFHSNGRVRQRAVERLATSADPVAVAFLLLRVNDWVPQVREPALRALEQRLERSELEGFVRFIQLLFRLDEVKRNDLHAFVEKAKAALREPAAQGAILQGCHSADRGVRRNCLTLAIEARAGDLRPLLRDAMDDPDVIIRRTAAQSIGAAYPIDQLEPVLKEMLDDVSCQVRGTALEIYAERLPAAAIGPLREGLFDPAGPVRETARFELGKKGVGDFAALYRERLGVSNPVELATALAGLGETGSAPDASLVTPLLENGVPRVRAAAVRALARLGGAQVRDKILEMLADRSPRVSRCAREALFRLPSVTARSLDDLATSSTFRHARLNAIDLLIRADYWGAPTMLLRLGQTDDSEVAVHATSKLSRWLAKYNTVATSPSRQVVDELKAQLLEFNPNVEAGLLRALRSLLPSIEKRAAG